MLEHFKQLISSRIGLQVEDLRLLQKTIATRVHSLGMPNLHQYYNLLEADSVHSSGEWRHLIESLTTGESYFFRDRGQFEILRTHIFPELIRRKEGQKTIRIWSAGCATGEETYSIAIELFELLPRVRHFNTTIIGTDINPKAVERARTAIYNDWSFRMVDPEVKRRYFVKKHDGWHLDKQIKDMVTFQVGNLVTDSYPHQSKDICDMDLIVCRNVFIYFDKDTVASIIGKFTDTLNESGYLLTGHAELHMLALGALKSFIHPASIIYQKVTGQIEEEKSHKPCGAPPLPPAKTFDGTIITPPPQTFTGMSIKSPDSQGSNARTTTIAVAATPTSESILTAAAELYGKGNYAAAIKRAGSLLLTEPTNLAAIVFLARTHANMGDYTQSAQWCEKALNINPLEVTPYFVLAQIAESAGQLQRAGELFKKIMYIDPSFVPAYIELGALYERQNDPLKAAGMRRAAIEILRELPPDKTVQPYDEYTVAELLAYVSKLITP
ncbi:MAG: tetratricopeptide repeat protein [Nitrospirae bacterium]|nr:tetratricopeptide repeat protein [Nitrospirota bacterium]